MKKLIKISALAILAMGLVFNFAACSSGDDDDNNNTNTEESGPNSGSTTTTGITPVTYTVETDGAGSMTGTSEEANGGLTIFTSTAGDITVVTVSGTKPKLDSSKYVQFNTKSAEFDTLVITVSAACKATFTINASGNSAGKAYSIEGTALTKADSYYTVELSLSAGENTITGSGYKFSAIAFE